MEEKRFCGSKYRLSLDTRVERRGLTPTRRSPHRNQQQSQSREERGQHVGLDSGLDEKKLFQTEVKTLLLFSIYVLLTRVNR